MNLHANGGARYSLQWLSRQSRTEVCVLRRVSSPMAELVAIGEQPLQGRDGYGNAGVSSVLAFACGRPHHYSTLPQTLASAGLASEVRRSRAGPILWLDRPATGLGCGMGA